MALSVLALGASALVVTPGAPIQPALRARCPAPQALVEPHDLPAVFNLLAEIVDDAGERVYG